MKNWIRLESGNIIDLNIYHYVGYSPLGKWGISTDRIMFGHNDYTVWLTEQDYKNICEKLGVNE